MLAYHLFFKAEFYFLLLHIAFNITTWPLLLPVPKCQTAMYVRKSKCHILSKQKKSFHYIRRYLRIHCTKSCSNTRHEAKKHLSHYKTFIPSFQKGKQTRCFLLSQLDAQMSPSQKKIYPKFKSFISTIEFAL